MTTVKTISHAAWTWIRGYTPRWITLTLMIFFTAANFNVLGTMEETRQQQRVEGRCSLRGVFIDLYDYIDQQPPNAGRDPNPAVKVLRIRLDDKYPALVPDKECPK